MEQHPIKIPQLFFLELLPQFNYQADAGLCAEASQIVNDALAAAAGSSDRLVAIGTVPLQDCGRAVAEMER